MEERLIPWQGNQIKIKKVLHMKVIGLKENLMALDPVNTQMDPHTKDSGKIANNMEKERKYFQMDQLLEVRYCFTYGLIWLGQFEKGTIHGEGVKILADGTQYRGQWVNGHFNKGKVLNNGEEIEGIFERSGTLRRSNTKKTKDSKSSMNLILSCIKP